MQMNLAKSCDAKDIDHRFDATVCFCVLAALYPFGIILSNN